MPEIARARTPMSDEQIRTATIGEVSLLNGPVRLVSYDSQWPVQYERQAARIKTALGGRAIRIEHVGSTSVPGLVAKPVIDILLVVENSADEPSYVPDLELAGFVLRIREPQWHEHRLFKRPDVDLNLHVFSQGSTEIQRMLLFRDWLRGNPGDRELYARTKRDLAARTWKFRQNYADAKTEVIDGILSRATSSPTR